MAHGYIGFGYLLLALDCRFSLLNQKFVAERQTIRLFRLVERLNTLLNSATVKNVVKYSSNVDEKGAAQATYAYNTVHDCDTETKNIVDSQVKVFGRRAQCISVMCC